ncbi:phosphatidylserine decarboxylase [Spirosomataceae bacterium TFI 002]|nr:phosphatidylserine decarboxylase [Spirosomataceae bacterium TFI 002]
MKTDKSNNEKDLLNASMSIKDIHAEMENNPVYPFNLQSGWLPKPGSKSMQMYFEQILSTEPSDWAPCIQALSDFIDSNEVVSYLVQNACKENQNIRDAHLASAQGVIIPPIRDKNDILNAFNAILSQAPAFLDDALVGLPFSAFVVGIDPTMSGVTLFSIPMFNEKMAAILDHWNKFLDAEASNVGFRIDGQQWLSPAAKKQYDFPIWAKDSQILPYWNSWNSFFTRQFLDREASRPVADPTSNKTVICPNDGSLFRWRANISRNDVFWFKDMEYSLSDILSSPVQKDQDTIDQYDLVNIFEGGYIFQTYLNPYNFHRWWVPVNAKVMFDPIVVPGYFFNKLVIPDFGGASTASLPYLAQVNARGIIVFETEDYGRVCCIPLGMSEVSSISFDPAMVAGATVTKGQEMGTFNYGGSSFAIIYEKLPGKDLVFMNDQGIQYPQDPVLPSGSSSTGGAVTKIASKIGIWVDF